MRESGATALVRAFDQQRPQLRAWAARMLGSTADAEDAVQETWLRLARAPRAETIENLAGWLRTVLARICLDMLRARRSRREDLGLDAWESGSPVELDHAPPDPAEQAALADAVGRALLAVLDILEPAERIAFVLHDMFAVPHAEIADIIGRSPGTTKKLASRARHKVHGTTVLSTQDLAAHRAVVTAFLTAARAGDLDGILAVLAPDVVRHADPVTLAHGAATEVHGARQVAEGTVLLAERAAHADLALVDGVPGLIIAPHGQVTVALTFTIHDGLIQAYDVIADPGRLAALDLATLP